MATPKMTGMTPNSLGAGSFGFSPALLGQSPAAMLKHRSPIPSGNFHSPGMISALGMSGVEMSMNVTSTIGLAQTTHDETNKKELSDVLRLLGSRPGRVSEAAVERLAGSIGLECYKETVNGITTLSLGAKIFLLDIDFVGYHIERVALSFEKTQGLSTDLAPKAAAIFRKSLDENNKYLDTNSILPPFLVPFSDNLQRLATTDRLSTQNLNCFTAITGMYVGLNKIFEYEKKNMGGELAALCYGNGMPQMHARRKVGLSIHYWRERQTLSTMAHDIGDNSDEEDRLWRVMIEVQEAPTEFEGLNSVTPVRVSDHWVSDDVKKLREDNIYGEIDDFITDWLEPPLEELLDVSDDLSQARPPSARFLARLDPPVVVPVLDEIDPTHTYSGSTQINLMAALLFPDGTEKERKIFISAPERENPIKHHYRLHSSLKPVYSRQISEIPFSHPKDLLPIFKTLRQYVLITTLLEGSFRHESSNFNKFNHTDLNIAEDLDSFLDSIDSVPGPLPVDISLAPEHGFGISVVFPMSSSLIHLLIHVEKNAELKVSLPEDNNHIETSINVKAVERVLRASEDIGLAIEWCRN